MAGRERMGARRCGDEDDCLTVYAHECMWMTSIVVFISDVWNILSSYICFLSRRTYAHAGRIRMDNAWMTRSVVGGWDES